MSSYKNLKNQIKNLTDQLQAEENASDFLRGRIEGEVKYSKSLEDKIRELENKSWWERLWDF